ncbi:hypothetical protein GUJ93_ZPchr0003g17355 [Zizania palustris]|uniref:Uncharacterized protein n=1 Tax=Zizania palustris TaxID=103762 RepID=A0A8J5VK31_ZIZPA|nr:hypothetical protein GUJ93_ZPchr0003g17355 [Zizania palustris]
MDNVWPWLAGLPPPPPGGEALPQSVDVTLAASLDGATSIVLQAECEAAADGDSGEMGEAALVTFSLALNGANGAARSLWTSGRFAAISNVALRRQLLARLLDEVIALSPFVPCLSTMLGDAPETGFVGEVVAGVVEMADTDGSAPSASTAFFSLALLLRLFWLCAGEAPADTGFLFFQALGADIECALGDCRPALGVFLRSVGPDVEERFMRSLGYMLAKWCLLREMQEESAARQASQPAIPRRALPVACPSYATEVHGLWVLKGYAPVLAMARVTGAASTPITALPHEVPEEPALRYGLVHQQLEVVAQLEYAVRVRDPRFMSVGLRVDNIRVRVARLGFRKDDADVDGEDADDTMNGERHFPSRLRLWVGPRFGSSYATGPSLGRSTGNPERDVEMTRTVKGAFAGATKLANANGGVVPARVKAKMLSSARTRNRSWRWEQEAEGSAGVFEGVLCDPVTGTEISAWRAGNGGGAGAAADPRNGMRRRYGGPGRAFSKMRGLVVAGDELPEEVTWRVGREAEGRTVPWRLGLKAWVSYLPNEVRSRHFETRCIEWVHEVELPLVAVNGDD